MWTAVEATPTSSTSIKKDLKIICYFELLSKYAADFRDHSSEVVDEMIAQCTHIIYRHRVPWDLSENLVLNDREKLFYDRVPEFRKKGINVSINFLEFNGYKIAKHLAENKSGDENRTVFVEKLVGFMERNQFNGFDVVWYKQPRQGPRNTSHDEYFMDFMRECSEAFRPRGWLLSTLIPSIDEVTSGFDIQRLSELVFLMCFLLPCNLITFHFIFFDFRYVDWVSTFPDGRQQQSTALVTPLYFYPGDIDQELTSNFSVNYLIEKGVPPQKLVLGIFNIAHEYRLRSPEDNGLNAPAEKRLRSTKFFNEFCDSVTKTDKWTVVHNPDKRIGTYAYFERRWISYSDVEDVQHKAEYMIQKNLGGGAYFFLNDDDFEIKCECGKSLLLRALAQALRNASDPKMENCT